MAIDPRGVVEAHLRRLRDWFAGADVDVLALLHPQVQFIVPGLLPVSGVHDLDFLRDRVFGGRAAQMRRRPGIGHYAIEWFAQDDRVVVIARGRFNTADGSPYNNTYFMSFRIQDGLIHRFTEIMDGSLFMQAMAGTHLEPAPPPA